MKMLSSMLIVVTSAALMIGCNTETSNTQASTNTSENVIEVASFPPDLFSLEPIASPASLLSVKESAKAGDEVSFVAAIGGRANPFIDGRAVMVVSDLDLAFCIDGCPVPWDACCSPSEDIAKLTAMVQVVDEDGNPLHLGLGEKLKPGSQVHVTGVVDRVEEGTYVINAHSIHAP